MAERGTMAEPRDLREAPWHVREGEAALSAFDVDPERGLSAGEAGRRLEEYGENRIRSGEVVPWWRLVLRQFTDPLIYILLVAALVSLLIEEYVDAAVILIVVLINGTVGFVQELRARKAIRALARMSEPKAKVVREGEEREIPTEEVVPGDIVVLAAGGRVPADVRILAAEELQADESALTGESEPAAKQAHPVEEERAVPGDQLSMAFSGTSITRGRGRGVVVRTGAASELGHIAEATQDIADVKTPIKEKMERLGRRIGWATLALSLLVVAGGLVAGAEFDEVIRTAVALAVGAVPEALPVVLTVTLAVGMQRMARRNAIIRSLPAVETLGSTTVIGSDKTGTLTRNQMTVRLLWAGGERFDVGGSGYDAEGEIRPADDGRGEISEAGRLTVLAGMLANEARCLPGRQEEDGGEDGRAGEVAAGDPTELALLAAAAKAGYVLEEVRDEYAQVDVIPFESDRQFMATLNETPNGRCVFLKGSPEAVLHRCSEQLSPGGDSRDLDAAAARRAADELAGRGYRVLGMALRHRDLDRFEGDDPGADLVFAGFQALEDPVRSEAVDAVRAAHEAGIRVIMLTGDHARTARAIGEQLGLAESGGRVVEGKQIDDCSEEEFDALVRDVNVFARVSPDHKLKLVERLRDQGQIVAVTGDGVNDAPALQAAHLGVAMGKAGTDVAREASDMILADDNFASITNAVEEGRVAFSNIRKVTYFLLSTAAGIVLVILSSLLGPWPLPFLPVQVLWINLVTSGLQDVALAFEKGEPGLLRQPPRDPREGVLNRMVLWRLAGFGVLMAAGTLVVFWWMLQQAVSLELARSVAMTQMVLFQFFHVLNSRSFHRSVFRVPLTDNPFLALSLGLALLAHVGALYLPLLQRLFDTEPLALEHWALVGGVGLSIIAVAEFDKLFLRRREREPGSGAAKWGGRPRATGGGPRSHGLPATPRPSVRRGPRTSATHEKR